MSIINAGKIFILYNFYNLYYNLCNVIKEIDVNRIIKLSEDIALHL